MDFQEGRVNDISELGDAGLWEDHDQPKWTSKLGITQATLARFMLECDMDPSSDSYQYLVLTQNEGKEGDDEMISCWNGDGNDQFFNEVGRNFPNKGEDLYDITEAMHVWKPLMGENWSTKLKKGKGKSGKP